MSEEIKEEKENKKLNIGVDAMGGDNAPCEILNGVCDFLNDIKDENIIITLFGKEDIIQSNLVNLNINLNACNIAQIIEKDVLEYTGEADQADDITVFVLDFTNRIE